MSDASDGDFAHTPPAQASAYKMSVPKVDTPAGKLKATLQQKIADRSRKGAAKNANA